MADKHEHKPGMSMPEKKPTERDASDKPQPKKSAKPSARTQPDEAKPAKMPRKS